MNQWDQQSKDYRDKLLAESLAKCTQPQIDFFFRRIYPDGGPEEKWSNAMDQISRTLKKNEAGKQNNV